MEVRDVFSFLIFVWLWIQWNTLQTILLRIESQIAQLEANMYIKT